MKTVYLLIFGLIFNTYLACSGDVTVHGMPERIELVPGGCGDAGHDG